MKKKVAILLAVLFVSAGSVCAIQCKLTCSDGSQHMFSAWSADEMVDIASVLCD